MLLFLANVYFVYSCSSLAGTAPEFGFQFVSFLSSMIYMSLGNNRSCIFGDITISIKIFDIDIIIDTPSIYICHITMAFGLF